MSEATPPPLPVEPAHPNDLPFRQPGHFMSAASQKLDAFLGKAIAELKPTETKPAMTTGMGFQPGEISGLFKSLRARKEAMIANIKSSGAEAEAVIAAGEKMGSDLQAEADAMKAEFGQLTNFPPA